jgi:hypothetical protein
MFELAPALAFSQSARVGPGPDVCLYEHRVEYLWCLHIVAP